MRRSWLLAALVVLPFLISRLLSRLCLRGSAGVRQAVSLQDGTVQGRKDGVGSEGAVREDMWRM